MTGRGIDQVLAHPSSPELHEQYVRSALEYVELAEQANGPLPKPVADSYVWGDALAEWERVQPSVRIANLETSITTCEDYCDGKEIHYRMHPANAACLTAAGFDCCVLANNHMMDWGRAGLGETLRVLEAAGIARAGAGRDLEAAWEPAVLARHEGPRVLVFSAATRDSGVPSGWAATNQSSGVALLEDLSERTVAAIGERVRACKRRGDVVVFSIHWGGNWKYRIADEQRTFAHRLLDTVEVDLIHGHSSHHPKGIEMHRGKLILYGCGDFLNDYEGIAGFEVYRGDLSLMYFATLDPESGRLLRLEMTPMQMHRFRLRPATAEDARWLCDTLQQEGLRLGGTAIGLDDDHRLILSAGS